MLQLAVTMDYSIFLWHSYNEQRGRRTADKNEAMATAIHETLTSVVGSSITTVAGFIALCFMSFTLGRDLGVVMAKGVLLGVIGCVTVLPSLILLFDQARCRRRKHQLADPGTPTASPQGVTKHFPLFLVLFVAFWLPRRYIGYRQNQRRRLLRHGCSACREDIDYVIANNKLHG